MEFGAKFIGTVRKNTKKLGKEIIEKLTKDWPGGSYLMLRSKTIVPGVWPLIYIGYNYNAWKFLTFIVTDSARITQAGPPHLSKYPDQFTNVAIRPVDRPPFHI